MEIDEPTSSKSNYPSTNSNMSSIDNADNDEYEEEISYIIIDLGTEVTLDMITNNFEILNNINPSSFNFNQNQDSLSLSTSILDPQQQPPNSIISNEANDATASTTTTNYSQKSFHYYIKPSAVHEEGVEGDKHSNNKENGDIDYSLIGLDTDTPYLRIGNIHFKGEYDETIGTDLIFYPEPDPMNPRQQKLTYQCQTTKKIKFSQVNLQEINLDTTNDLSQFNIHDDNEWEDKFLMNNKNYSLDNQELFNIKSDLHDNSDDESDKESDNDESQNKSVSSAVMDKGKRIVQEKEVNKMEIDDGGNNEHLDY